MAVKSDVLAVISMLSFSLFIRFEFPAEGIYVTSLTLQVIEPTSMPPVFAEGDNKHSDHCKITAGSWHGQSHQSRCNGHKKPVSIHPSNSCLRADLQRQVKGFNAAISLQTGSGTNRTRHFETPLPAIWQHNVSLQTFRALNWQF